MLFTISRYSSSCYMFRFWVETLQRKLVLVPIAVVVWGGIHDSKLEYWYGTISPAIDFPPHLFFFLGMMLPYFFLNFFILLLIWVVYSIAYVSLVGFTLFWWNCNRISKYVGRKYIWWTNMLKITVSQEEAIVLLQHRKGGLWFRIFGLKFLGRRPEFLFLVYKGHGEHLLKGPWHFPKDK